MKTSDKLQKLTNSQMKQITGGEDVTYPFKSRIPIIPPPPPPPPFERFTKTTLDKNFF